MIQLHPQDQEFINTCRTLKGNVGMVAFFSTTDPHFKTDFHYLHALGEIQQAVSIRTGLDLVMFPIIGLIPDNTKRAGLKYALKIVSVDEELIKMHSCRVGP